MYLIQVLLPLYDNAGRPLAPALHQAVGTELTERFGGLTAYTRAPAQGLWKEDDARTHRDDIVISTRSWRNHWTARGGPTTAKSWSGASDKRKWSSAPSTWRYCKASLWRARSSANKSPVSRNEVGEW
jgi:hypothetical protein